MEKQIAEKARRFRLWWLLVIILAAAASGCSSGGGAGTGVSSIAGRVTYYDLTGQQAAPTGVVVGVSGTAAWDTQVEGTAGAYQIKGIPAGTYRIVVKEVKGLPASTVVLTEPSGGIEVKLAARIPMIDVNLAAISMPGLPDL